VTRSLRRLGAAQIIFAIRDVLGPAAGDKAEALITLGSDSPYVDSGFLGSLLTAAEEIAAAYAGAPGGLAACGDASEATCVRDQVAALGERLFRRPLSSDELARLTASYARVAAEATRPRAVAMLVASLLASPHFLYRIEGGTPAGSRVDPHDVAGRLALAIWDSVPDQVLLAAARGGRLAAPLDLSAQATRMLADAKARRLVDGFFAALVPYEEAARAMRSQRLYPGVNADLLAAFVTETRTFLGKAFFEDGASFADLFTSGSSYINSKLAAFYGAPAGMGAGNDFRKVALPAAQRAGLLTQASVLTALAHPDEGAPVLRGLLVRRELLCETVPEPPADVNNPPPPGPGLSQRVRLAQHSAGSCAACHMLFDPIGFGFENYDAVGRFVTSENGHALTGEGRVPGLDGGQPTFKGAVELGRLLAQSAQARRCFVRRLSAHMMGAKHVDLGSRTLDDIDHAFVADGVKLGRLPLAVVTSPAFLTPRLDGRGTPGAPQGATR
jgi:hypothetical protein